MNKQQAYSAFWNGFGVLAFEENSAPTSDVLKQLAAAAGKPTDIYITYQVLVDDLDGKVFPTASIWSKSSSWEKADTLSNTISSRIEAMSTIKLDNGRMFITKGSPFAQHMGDEGDQTIKRIILNLGIEFLTQF